MTPEEEYINKLEAETGLSLSKGDFGFIVGTNTPFDIDSQTAKRKGVYIIWRRFIKDNVRSYVELETTGLDFEGIKTFLTLEGENLNNFITSFSR